MKKIGAEILYEKGGRLRQIRATNSNTALYVIPELLFLTILKVF